MSENASIFQAFNVLVGSLYNWPDFWLCHFFRSENMDSKFKVLSINYAA